MPTWKAEEEEDEEPGPWDNWQLKRLSFVVHVDAYIKREGHEQEIEQEILDMIATNIDSKHVTVKMTSTSLGLMEEAVDDE